MSSSPLLFRLMELDQQARWGLFWVGLWGIVFLGMVVNAAVNDYPFGAFFFFGVFVFSAWRWYGNLYERIRKREREEALRTSGFDQIDMMPGIQFEQYVAAVLKGLGYHVAFTSTTGDFGVDLIATKNGKRTAVQCKRKGGGAVGGAAVQQVVAGAPMHGCTATMVVMNNLFTRAAQQLAEVHNCSLVDRCQLERLVLSTRSHMSSTSRATRSEATNAPCIRPTSTQADADVCTGFNGLQTKGEGFYKTYRHLMRTGGRSKINALMLKRELDVLATVGAPPGQTDGSAAINAASSDVRLALTKMVRDADRLAQRCAHIANGSPTAGIDREITQMINSFTKALIACADAGHAPSGVSPK